MVRSNPSLIFVIELRLKPCHREKDINLYNEQSARMQELLAEHEKMRIRVDMFEKRQHEMEEDAR